MLNVHNFFICAHAQHVYTVLTIKVCHDFTINSSRKSRDINCLRSSGYYPVS